jgi:hypothetical protein
VHGGPTIRSFLWEASQDLSENLPPAAHGAATTAKNLTKIRAEEFYRRQDAKFAKPNGSDLL